LNLSPARHQDIEGADHAKLRSRRADGPGEQRLIMRVLALSPEVAAITKGLSRPTDAAAVLGPVKVRPGSGGA
jgi:hypothetical protein